MNYKKLFFCLVLGFSMVTAAMAQCPGVDDLEVKCVPLNLGGGTAKEPCPFKICIAQRVECMGPDSLPFSCSDLFEKCSEIKHVHGGPDAFSQLCFYTIPEIGLPGTGCRLLTESVSIQRVGTGETITLWHDDAQLFMDIINGVAGPDAKMYIGTFKVPCGEQEGYLNLELIYGTDWSSLFMTQIP